MIRATFGALDKLKDDKGMLVYEGNSVKEANQAEYEFVEGMGMQFGVPAGNGGRATRVIDDKENNRRFIDFGSHTLFIMEKFEDIYYDK